MTKKIFVTVITLSLILTVTPVTIGRVTLESSNDVLNDVTEIYDWYDLDNIRVDLDSDYVLMNDLDENTEGYDEIASQYANELIEKGVWEQGKEYENNERVRERGESNSEAFYCIKPHTSSSENKPGEGGNWEDYWTETNKEAGSTLGFDPIGLDNYYGFSGVFCGNGNRIKDFFIDRGDEEFVGLFASNVDGTIKNVEIVHADVTGLGWVAPLVGVNMGVVDNCITENVTVEAYKKIEGFYQNGVGGLVGRNGWEYSVVDKTIEITNSKTINPKVEGDIEVGGFVGRNDRTIVNCSAKNVDVYGGHRVGGFTGVCYFDSHTERCSSSGFVEGYDIDFENLFYRGNVGGFVGYYASSILPPPTMEQVFSTADVKGFEKVGGFVGEADNYPPYLKNAFSTGDVEGTDYVGGFAGVLGVKIYQAYSTGNVVGETNTGGFSGGDLDYGATVENCYWNKDTSGQTDSFHGLGRSTEDMTYPHAETKDTFYDFDKDVWDLGDHAIVEDREGNTGYPVLRWQLEIFDLTINIEGEGITDPEEGTHKYYVGEEVKVEAISSQGWYFVEWTGDYEGKEKEISIVMDDDKFITAHFSKEVEVYDLTIVVKDEENEPIDAVKVQIDDMQRTTDEHGEVVFQELGPGSYRYELFKSDYELKEDEVIVEDDVKEKVTLKQLEEGQLKIEFIEIDTTVEEDEKIVIKYRIENTGSTTIREEIEILINRNEDDADLIFEYHKIYELEDGESKQNEIKVKFEEVGNYNVSISGSLHERALDYPDPVGIRVTTVEEDEISLWMIIGIIVLLAMILAITGYTIIYRWRTQKPTEDKEGRQEDNREEDMSYQSDELK